MPRAKIPAAKSRHEEAFAIAWRAMGGYVPARDEEVFWTRCPLVFREVMFDHARDWRFDFANRRKKIAIEIEGGIVRRKSGKLHAFGRHTRGQGFSDDCEKYFRAAALGWRVFRLTPQMIDTEHVRAIMEAMA